MTPRGWLPYIYIKKNLVVCVCVCRSCSSWNHNQQLSTSDRSQHNPPFKSHVLHMLIRQFQMPNSHLLITCLGCCQIQTSFALIFLTVSSLSSQLIYLANISSISFNLQKKKQRKLFCSAISNCYTKLVWFLGKKLGRSCEKTKTAGVYDLGLQTFQLWVPSHETSMIPHWGQRCSNAGYIRSGPVDFGRNPLANRYYNSHLVAKSRSMTRNKLGKKSSNQTWGWHGVKSFSEKKNTGPSKFKAFCFPLNINLFCYIPKMPTETNGENSTQLQGCDSPL